MLLNINPILNGELLNVLRTMGHGDELVIVDCNFPAYSISQKTTIKKLIRMDGIDIPMLSRAIFSVFPLDSFVKEPILRMEIDGQPGKFGECHQDLKRILNESYEKNWEIGSIERHKFYERSKKAYAIVSASGERRGYGCFILIKGVINEDGKIV